MAARESVAIFFLVATVGCALSKRCLFVFRFVAAGERLFVLCPTISSTATSV